MKKLLALSDSKTEHLPEYLPLVPGMPVILTQNIAIEISLINGTNDIFRQLVSLKSLKRIFEKFKFNKNWENLGRL